MFGPIESSVTLDTTAPPHAVWAALESAPRWPEVLNDLIEAHIEPDGVLAPGAVMRARARPGSKAKDMTYSVIEVEKPRRLLIASTGSDFTAQSRYAIEETAEGSRVTITTCTGPVLWLHKITTAFARDDYTKNIAAALQERTRAMLTLAERIAAEERS